MLWTTKLEALNHLPFFKNVCRVLDFEYNATSDRQKPNSLADRKFCYFEQWTDGQTDKLSFHQRTITQCKLNEP